MRRRKFKFVRGSVLAPIADVVSLVVDVAARAGLELNSDDQVRAIACDTVQHVEQTFQRMKDAGQLRDLNQRYRAYRLARVAAGAPAQTYNAWITAQMVALIKATGEIVSRRTASAPTASA